MIPVDSNLKEAPLPVCLTEMCRRGFGKSEKRRRVIPFSFVEELKSKMDLFIKVKL